MSPITDYERPDGKQTSQHGRKFTPTLAKTALKFKYEIQTG